MLLPTMLALTGGAVQLEQQQNDAADVDERLDRIITSPDFGWIAEESELPTVIQVHGTAPDGTSGFILPNIIDVNGTADVAVTHFASDSELLPIVFALAGTGMSPQERALALAFPDVKVEKPKRAIATGGVHAIQLADVRTPVEREVEFVKLPPSAKHVPATQQLAMSALSNPEIPQSDDRQFGEPLLPRRDDDRTIQTSFGTIANVRHSPLDLLLRGLMHAPTPNTIKVQHFPFRQAAQTKANFEVQCDCRIIWAVA